VFGELRVEDRTGEGCLDSRDEGESWNREGWGGS
jgi:hypothetical protein